MEHDAFVMFEQLMGTTGSWFRNKPVKAPTGDELVSNVRNELLLTPSRRRP